MTTTIVVAGATGNLGGQIAAGLVKRAATVRGLVRASTAEDKRKKLAALGVQLTTVDETSVASVTQACMGASCVVSAVAGLRPVIVDFQSVLLESAVKARVPHFIPSDFASDFTKLPKGENRNFDFRREFRERLLAAPIKATSVLSGAFADMLFTQMRAVDFVAKTVTYWENPDQKMDYTTIADTAAYTVDVALDPAAPGVLRIAGDQKSARDLQALLSEVTKEPYTLVRAGGLGDLAALIAKLRAADKGPETLYPPWQSLQYAHGMASGLGKLTPLDNDRYPGHAWTTARDLLLAHLGRSRG